MSDNTPTPPAPAYWIVSKSEMDALLHAYPKPLTRCFVPPETITYCDQALGSWPGNIVASCMMAGLGHADERMHQIRASS